jgi:hypothetical protein
MHYKNGREAHNGDVVILIPDFSANPIPQIGILYNVIAGNDCCNGRLAVINRTLDPYLNLAECLHIDDVVTPEHRAPKK